jgi:predicted HTH transcriptional regulator
MSTREKIKQILTNEELDQFVGLKEDLWFDAKQKHGYDFSSPDGRIELAKDVSGFANSDGGYLVIGLETAVVVEEKTETVSAVALLSRADFKIGQVQGLIKEHIYPEPVGIDVTFVGSKTSPDQGLAVIEVPRQDEKRKYFLMVRVIEDGQQLKQIVFGVARRNGSSTEPLTFQEVYRMTQNGKSEGAQRLTRIEEKMDAVLRGLKPTAASSSPIDVEALINKILKS